MKALFAKSIVTAAAATLASAALAQQPAPPPQPQSPPPQQPAVPAPDPQQVEVSDSQLDTFTTIYAEMQVLTEEIQQELSNVESEEEAVEIQARAQEATTELISDHGWSLDQYNRIARAINAQPDVLERALELINEKI